MSTHPMQSTVTITPIAAGNYIFTLTTPEDVETYNQPAHLLSRKKSRSLT